MSEQPLRFAVTPANVTSQFAISSREGAEESIELIELDNKSSNDASTNDSESNDASASNVSIGEKREEKEL